MDVNELAGAEFEDLVSALVNANATRVAAIPGAVNPSLAGALGWIR